MNEGKHPFGNRFNSIDNNYAKRPSTISEDYLLQFLNSNAMSNLPKESIETDLNLYSHSNSTQVHTSSSKQDEKNFVKGEAKIVKTVDADETGFDKNNGKKINLNEIAIKSDSIFKVFPDYLKSNLWDQLPEEDDKKILSKKRAKENKGNVEPEAAARFPEVHNASMNGGAEIIEGLKHNNQSIRLHSNLENCGGLLDKLNDNMREIDNSIKNGSLANIHSRIAQTQKDLNYLNAMNNQIKSDRFPKLVTYALDQVEGSEVNKSKQVLKFNKTMISSSAIITDICLVK